MYALWVMTVMMYVGLFRSLSRFAPSDRWPVDLLGKAHAARQPHRCQPGQALSDYADAALISSWKGHGMSRVRFGRMLFLLFFIRWVGSFSVGQHGAHIDLLRRFALVCSVLLHGWIWLNDLLLWSELSWFAAIHSPLMWRMFKQYL